MSYIYSQHYDPLRFLHGVTINLFTNYYIWQHDQKKWDLDLILRVADFNIYKVNAEKPARP